MKLKLAFRLLALIHAFAVFSLSAQTIYVPGGTVGNNTSNSNVGIGTSAPSQRLTIQAGHGDTQLRLFSDLWGQGADGANTSILTLWASEPGWTWTGAGIGNNVVNSVGIVRVTATRGASYIRFLDNSITLNTIDSQGNDRYGIIVNNGNVGIGTNPGGLLDVNGRAGASSLKVAGTFAELINSSPWYGIGMSSVTLPGGGTTAVQIAGWAGLNLQTGAGQVVITQGGNVGIGTTDPTQKLAVNGTIRAKEVIVDTGWSDYVFDDDYQLAPLVEVESHIRSERHLPGIPTANEVAAKGISLGEMQAKLLAKVEELTLHLIEQDKRIQKLEAENAALRDASRQPASVD
jgi:hypothetical protein